MQGWFIEQVRDAQEKVQDSRRRTAEDDTCQHASSFRLVGLKGTAEAPVRVMKWSLAILAKSSWWHVQVLRRRWTYRHRFQRCQQILTSNHQFMGILKEVQKMIRVYKNLWCWTQKDWLMIFEHMEKDVSELYSRLGPGQKSFYSELGESEMYSYNSEHAPKSSWRNRFQSFGFLYIEGTSNNDSKAVSCNFWKMHAPWALILKSRCKEKTSRVTMG